MSLHHRLTRIVLWALALQFLLQPVLMAVSTEVSYAKSQPLEAEAPSILISDSVAKHYGASVPEHVLIGNNVLPSAEAGSEPMVQHASSSTAITKYTYNVNAGTALPGNNSGIQVKAGQIVTVTATGMWYWSLGCPADGCIAGYPTFPETWDLVAPQFTQMALLGRIGTSGSWNLLGSSGSFIAPADGPLYMIANDRVGWFHDNSGYVVATILVKEPMFDRGSAGGPDGNCPCENTMAWTQQVTRHSINTRTGNEAFSITDLSIQTEAGALTFTRSYSTFNARDVAGGYLAGGSLSAGWVHNFEVRLLFPPGVGVPLGGEAGKVLIQTPGGSRIGFVDTSGIYTPEAGTGGTLTRAGSAGSYTYTYRNSQDVTYVFDNAGRLIQMGNGRGQNFTLKYVGNETYIAAQFSGTTPIGRYLQLSHVNGRLTQVASHSSADTNLTDDPTVQYTYDTLNLIKVKDVRGSYWNYSYAGPNLAGFGSSIAVISYVQHYIHKRYQATTNPAALLSSLTIQIENLYESAANYTSDNGRTYVRATEERDQNQKTIIKIDFQTVGGPTITHGQGTGSYTTFDIYGLDKTLTGERNAAGTTNTQFAGPNYRPSSVRSPNNNQVTTMDWSTDGTDLLSINDGVNPATQMVYDSRHHVVQIKNPDGSKTVFIYNQPTKWDPTANSGAGGFVTNPDVNPAWDQDLLLKQISNYQDGNPATGNADQDLITSYQYTVGSTGAISNVAVSKPATQSSTGWDGVASRAVDNNTNGNYAGNSVSHTLQDVNAWWSVDLQQSYYINTIDIWNRTDASSDRLANFYVFVSDEPFASTSLNATLSQVGVSSYYFSGQVGTSTSIPIYRSGRYVRIQLAGTNYLNLAEVKVMGGAIGGVPNLPSKITGPDGLATCYTYNAYGQTTQVTENCGLAGQERVSTSSYDSMGRLVMSVDPLNRATVYRYLDNNNQPSAASEPSEVIENYDGPRTNPVTDPATYLSTPSNYYKNNLYNFSTRTYRDAQGRVIAVVKNYTPDNPGTGAAEAMDFDGDLSADATLEVAADRTDLNQISVTRYDSRGRVRETITNFWPSQPPYHLNQYNLSTRTFYDGADHVVATVVNYKEADLPGSGVPQQMDFDLDRTYDAMLEVSPEASEYNQITCTTYNTAGWVVFVRTACVAPEATPAPNPIVPFTNYLVIRGHTYNLVTAYEYDMAGNITKTIVNFDTGVVDSNQNAGSITVNLLLPGAPSTGLLVDPETPDRNVITCTTYDPLNRPIYVREACLPGVPDFFGPDTYPPLTWENNVYNLLTAYFYDSMGRQIATIENYQISGGWVDLTPERNHITRTYYDALGRVEYTVTNFGGSAGTPHLYPIDSTPVTNLVPSAEFNNITRTYYDSQGRQIAVVNNYNAAYLTNDASHAGDKDQLTDANLTAHPEFNHVTRTFYNAQGQVSQTVTNYVGNFYAASAPAFDANKPDRNLISAYGYDSAGRQVDTTVSRGSTNRTNHVTFNVLGQVTQSTANYNGTAAPTNVTTAYQYDLMGRQTQITDPGLKVQKTVYDALGRVIETIANPSGLSLTSTSTFDAAGRVTQIKNGANEITTLRYDALGRQIEMIVDPGGVNLITKVTYNTMGQTLTSEDASGVVTRYQYDNLGRVIYVYQNASGAPSCTSATSDQNVCTRYTYDDVGNRVSMTLGNGSTTTYQYDAMGHLTHERIDPNGTNILTIYTYDGAGNQVQIMRGATNPQTTTQQFDALGRLKAINYPAGTANVTYSYDAFGNRQTMVDGVGTWTYGYDALNHLTSLSGPNGNNLTYTYDANGNRATLGVAGLATPITYAYDNANRLDTISDPFAGSGVIDYVYDGASRVSQIIRLTQLTSAYQYDAAGRLKVLSHQSGTLSSFSYNLDNNGNRISATETLSTAQSDATAPVNPTGLNSTSHTVNVSSLNNTIVMVWNSDASDAGSGVAGYSILWDNSATTTPDTTIDLPRLTTSTTSVPSAVGSWYFHLRTCDNSGNCAAAIHAGPYLITSNDTTPPTNPSTLSSTSHTVNVSSVDNTVDVTWSNNASDSGSGVAGYSTEWTTVATTTPNTSVDRAANVYAETSPTLANGSTWYFHLRTCDVAGNCAAAVHLGPFIIDTTLILPVGYTEHSDSRIVYTGSWVNDTNASASGGSYKYTNDPTAKAAFWMNGASFTLYRAMAFNRGLMNVCIDNNPCTTVDNFTGKWWQVDLGAQYSVDQFVLYHAGSNGESTSYNTKDFNILASTDGVTWSRILAVTGNTSNVSNHIITPTTARYLKLQVVTPEQSPLTGAARIYEFKVYGNPASPPSTHNAALNKQANASGICGPINETYERAINGSLSDKWCDNVSANKWWTVNMQGTFRINQIKIYHAGAGGESTSFNTRDFNLQVSMDGINWTTVATVTGNTSNITTHNITPVTAQHVRLNITDPEQSAGTGGAARIYEFEVMGYTDTSLAHLKTTTASGSCAANETSDRAVNGTWSDKWCDISTPTVLWQQPVVINVPSGLHRVEIRNTSTAYIDLDAVSVSTTSGSTGLDATRFMKPAASVPTPTAKPRSPESVQGQPDCLTELEAGSPFAEAMGRDASLVLADANGKLFGEQSSYQAEFGDEGFQFTALGGVSDVLPMVKLTLDQIRKDDKSLPIGGNSDNDQQNKPEAGWHACDNIAYRQRGHGIIELVSSQADHAQVGYLLTRDPINGSGTDDLLLELALDTDLSIHQSSDGFFLLDEHDQGIRVGEAVAIDAAGDQIAVEIRRTQTGLAFVVPGTWLEEAVFPVLVDPDFIPWIHGVNSEQDASAAYDAANNRALIPYVNREGGSNTYNIDWRLIDASTGQRLISENGSYPLGSSALVDLAAEFMPTSPSGPVYLVPFAWFSLIYLLRIDASGVSLGQTQLSAAMGGNVGHMDIAVQPGASSARALIVFHETNNSIYRVRGLIIDQNGNVIVAPFSIAETSYDMSNPSVAYDPGLGQFVVAWSEHPNAQDSEIQMRTVSTSGSMGTVQQVTSDSNNDADTDAAYSATAGRVLITWQSDTDVNAIGVSNGSLSGQSVIVIRDTAGTWDGDAQVAAVPGGGWVVTFVAGPDVYRQDVAANANGGVLTA